jgi:glycosyltransferase involved in cell wall biosynthesis
MKIAYVTYANPDDHRSWSGLTYFMRRSLELAGLEVEVIGSMPFPVRFWPERFVREVAERGFGARRLIWTYDPRVIRWNSRKIERRLRASKAQAIFSPGSMVLSLVNTSLPVYFWSDATFLRMVDYYFPAVGLTQRTLRDGERMEYAAILKAKHAFYASDWAARSAVENYYAPERKVHVVPMGANLMVEPTSDEVERWIESRPARPCRFCLIGVDWTRKGADLAIQVVEQLRRDGLESELTILGCKPPAGTELPPWVHTLGYMRNFTEHGRGTIRRILAESHFLLVPSRAECFGLVFSEASAHGVPSLASDTGGIGTAVRNGINGYRVALDAEFVPRMAAQVIEIMKDPGRYQALARSSFNEFATRLNWKTSGKKIRAVMESA